ncbi:MAG: metallophosphoesterase [Armatimonadetes bacterium]|nr:metallophosphoesterase [Armatimonadota bacterium]
MIPSRARAAAAAASALAFAAVCWSIAPSPAQGRRGGGGGGGRRSFAAGPCAPLSQVLGRQTDRTACLSLLSATALETYVEYGARAGKLDRKTPVVTARAGEPLEITLDGLQPNGACTYRVRSRKPGDADFAAGPEQTFHTQRKPGAEFTFAVQGDSHPEREGRMFDSTLYARGLRNVVEQSPDFLVALGDDFSLERLIEQQNLTQSAVDQVYAHQRGYLGLVGAASGIFLVNGNHEQAALHWLNGTETNPAVPAARARSRFFALPAPDAFYSGDAEKVERIGYLRDYYAWTWGDALFAVIDPYWHSPVGVDDGRRGAETAVATTPAFGGGGRKRAGGGKGGRDLWQVTLGDAQYKWLSQTLTESKARYKFVFCHHVMGTGRGGVEQAGFYEWGGKDRNGAWRFDEKRPGWAQPIHALMVKTGVTILFQGHDHLFARQELDGVVYQSTPSRADPTYTAFNEDAYLTGATLPNSGHLMVHVGPAGVRVDYLRAYLEKDETGERKNGQVARSYTIAAGAKRP